MSIALSAATVVQWQKEKYEEISSKVGGHAVDFLRPSSKGKFFRYPYPKFHEITKGLNVALFDKDATMPLDETINSANFAADMFEDPSTLTIVSEPIFLLIYKAQIKVYENITTKNSALSDHKPVIWTMMEKGIPEATMNTIKAKENFETYYQNNDVEWLNKTIIEVVLTEQSGIPAEDYNDAQNRLTTCKQGENESLANYYKRFDQTYKTFEDLCQKTDEKPNKPNKYAAMFIKGLSVRHAEFVHDVRIWAKAKIKDYPLNYTEAYQRCSDYKSADKIVSISANGNANRDDGKQNAFSITSTTKTDPDQPKQEPKKIQVTRKATEKKDGVLKWKKFRRRREVSQM